MTTTAETLSSDSELEDAHFFDAAPGVKRSNSNDAGDEPVASTSRVTLGTETTSSRHSPHKRIRTKAPGPSHGVKRPVPSRRLSDRHLQDEQVRQSDSDVSFARLPRPNKRQKSAASTSWTDREESVPIIDEAPTLAPRRVSITDQRSPLAAEILTKHSTW